MQASLCPEGHSPVYLSRHTHPRYSSDSIARPTAVCFLLLRNAAMSWFWLLFGDSGCSTCVYACALPLCCDGACKMQASVQRDTACNVLLRLFQVLYDAVSRCLCAPKSEQPCAHVQTHIHACTSLAKEPHISVPPAVALCCNQGCGPAARPTCLL